jgi:hypothetical protein
VKNEMGRNLECTDVEKNFNLLLLRCKRETIPGNTFISTELHSQDSVLLSRDDMTRHFSEDPSRQ